MGGAPPQRHSALAGERGKGLLQRKLLPLSYSKTSAGNAPCRDWSCDCALWGHPCTACRQRVADGGAWHSVAFGPSKTKTGIGRFEPHQKPVCIAQVMGPATGVLPSIGGRCRRCRRCRLPPQCAAPLVLVASPACCCDSRRHLIVVSALLDTVALSQRGHRLRRAAREPRRPCRCSENTQGWIAK